MNKKFAFLAISICASAQSHATHYYPAQILGRDLGIKGLGWAGHVGLTIADHFSDTAEYVIEVLNEIDVIQINTIEHFKKNTRYWGSRYGIADQSPSADSIVKEALKQRALCPIYTDSATYHIGEGTVDKPNKCAVFRCDTFINYLFHYAGYTLPTYRGKTLPRLVFKAFPKTHDDGATNIDLPFEQFKLTFDLPTQQTTPQTIKKTWQLAQNPSLSLKKRIFLIDYLGLNGSPGLIHDFIDDYKKQTHAAIKSMLIRSTFTLYQTHFLHQPHTELQQFYQNLLSTPLPSKDIPIVLRGFIDLSDTQQKLRHQAQTKRLLQQHIKALPFETRISLQKLLT
ncbi:MAG: hypothetical protein P1U61_03460 [Legionellaceae bacterium]|nr:hypothetical protein [Legionellaceae bacterium]